MSASKDPAACSAVTICEVGPRDGLQSVAAVMPTAAKLRWIEALAAAGVCEIEVASFVPARLLPQMADADAVVRGCVAKLPDVAIVALVPNRRGAEAALVAGARKLTMPVSASVAHSLANVRRTPLAMVEELRAVHALRAEAQQSVGLEVGISTAFGCTLQGAVPEDDVIRLAVACAEAGADEVGLSDTVGYANPRAGAAIVSPAARRARRKGRRCASAQYARPWPGELSGRLSRRRDHIRRLARRPGWLPVCARAPPATS